MFLAGATWAALQWANRSQGKQVIRALDAITPGDLQKYIDELTEASVPSRIEPLQQADALMSYFEKTNNKDGKDAVAAVVAAIFAQRESS